MAQKTNISDWIIYENEDLFIVNKPPFVPSVPERGKYTSASILEEARLLFPEAIMCHRLDRETSGAIVIAKTPEMYRHMSVLFERRQVKKLYHAIVEGQIRFENLIVDLPIKVDQLDNIHIDKKFGKLAKTIFNTVKVFRHFTLMQCEPVSGRLHQIRVHLASQNAHIAGDILYGGKVHFLHEIKSKFKGEEKPMMSRFALHARTLSFELPDGENIEVTAPYPKDMDVFIKLLTKYDQ
jgi:23S rRNA pseudouridine955/2504/2580 synthase